MVWFSISAIVSFGCLVVSLFCFRRFIIWLAWVTMAGFVIFLLLTLGLMWHITMQ